MLLGCEIPEGRALKVPFMTVSPAPGAASRLEQVLAESMDTDNWRIDDVGSLGLEGEESGRNSISEAAAARPPASPCVVYFRLQGCV